ncbi:MAG: penicillin-binding protein 2 [Bacteroidales bacterium]|jgi:penicillin-binding protein 2|nr:penicillin-binding protein 2 [Bacteroidales bacterium]
MRKPYTDRKYIIIGFVIAVGIIFILKLFHIQIIDKSYKLSADNNVLRYMTQYPARGLIYDRNGKLMVYNEAAYDLMVVPRLVKNIDTVEFCNIIGIDRETFISNISRAKKYSFFKPSVFEAQISRETYGFLEEKLFKYPGFFVQIRTLRKYTEPIAAHILGYIGEVSNRVIESNPYYKMGDYIGISGIEKTYEEILRGKKGVKIMMVDVHNREVGNYMEGKFDTLSEMGSDIYLTIDAELQAYGEYLMKNKRGSIVAIEPATGEILALVSSPTYDPGLMVGRTRTKNYFLMSKDSLKPLFNRALMATYPPGSTFKMANALVALKYETLTPQSRYGCSGKQSQPIRCTHSHETPLALRGAIEHSCNSYFWATFRDLIGSSKFKNTAEAFQQWTETMHSFGLGKPVGGDLFGEQSGKIPQSGEYNRIYGVNRWRALTIRSLSIGQGEILLTPVQLANMATIYANRGSYYPPHLLRSVTQRSDSIALPEFKKKYTSVNQNHFHDIVDGMHQVFSGSHGTARWYRIDTIPMCGKTGTSENPHGKDHSLFIAFAPMDNPKIAIAVVVENSGFGATWAVPIATLMMEKYFNGEIVRKHIEERMVNAILY